MLPPQNREKTHFRVSSPHPWAWSRQPQQTTTGSGGGPGGGKIATWPWGWDGKRLQLGPASAIPPKRP